MTAEQCYQRNRFADFEEAVVEEVEALESSSEAVEYLRYFSELLEREGGISYRIRLFELALPRLPLLDEVVVDYLTSDEGYLPSRIIRHPQASARLLARAAERLVENLERRVEAGGEAAASGHSMYLSAHLQEFASVGVIRRGDALWGRLGEVALADVSPWQLEKSLHARRAAAEVWLVVRGVEEGDLLQLLFGTLGRDARVRAWVAEHPASTPAVWHRLLQDPWDREVLQALAENPQARAEKAVRALLHSFACFQDATVCRLLLEDGRPEEFRWLLSACLLRWPEWTGNEALPKISRKQWEVLRPEDIQELLSDSSPGVRESTIRLMGRWGSPGGKGEGRANGPQEIPGPGSEAGMEEKISSPRPLP